MSDTTIGGSIFLSSGEANDLRQLVEQNKALLAELEKAKHKDDWTKEKILAEPDQLKRQKLIREHWELFSSK